MHLVAITANENGDDQRAASNTEFHWNRHSRECNGDASENDTDDDAEEDGCDIRSLKTLDRVAEHISHTVYQILRSYHHHAVANLQRQTWSGKEFHALTGDTGHIHAVSRREMHLT